MNLSKEKFMAELRSARCVDSTKYSMNFRSKHWYFLILFGLTSDQISEISILKNVHFFGSIGHFENVYSKDFNGNEKKNIFSFTDEDIKEIDNFAHGMVTAKNKSITMRRIEDYFKDTGIPDNMKGTGKTGL